MWEGSFEVSYSRCRGRDLIETSMLRVEIASLREVAGTFTLVVYHSRLVLLTQGNVGRGRLGSTSMRDLL